MKYKIKSIIYDYFLLFKYNWILNHKFTINEGLRLCDLDKLLNVYIDDKYYNTIYKKNGIYYINSINSRHKKAVDIEMLKACSNCYFIA